jgi:hypothetical protein
MALPILRNRAWMSIDTTGTGAITLGSAQSGYQSFADAGITDAQTVSYTIIDGASWEVGTGTYTSSGTIMTRSVIESTNGDAALDLTADATVLITATSMDFARGVAPGLYNATITESRASSAATFALKTLAGTNPSSTDPVIAIFRNGSAYRITTATSVTINSTATMGASNATPFRIGISVVDDSGTMRLGVRNTSDLNNVFPFPANGIDTTTTIGTGADTAGITYTGTGATDKQFIVAAYADYESGLTTVGTWDAAPTRIQLHVSGSPSPGDTVQIRRVVQSTEQTTTSTSYTDVSGVAVSITPTSKINKIEVSLVGASLSPSADFVHVKILRGSTQIGSIAQMGGSASTNQSVINIDYLDSPAASTSTTYKAQFRSNNGGSVTFPKTTTGDGGTSMILVKEIMG